MVKVFEQNPKVTCTTTDYKEDANSFREIDKKNCRTGVAHTKYLLSSGVGGGTTESRILCPLAFLTKDWRQYLLGLSSI